MADLTDAAAILEFAMSRNPAKGAKLARRAGDAVKKKTKGKRGLKAKFRPTTFEIAMHRQINKPKE